MAWENSLYMEGGHICIGGVHRKKCVCVGRGTLVREEHQW